jgi:hypothetical protein
LKGLYEDVPEVHAVRETMRESGGYGEFGLRVVNEIDMKEGTVRDVLRHQRIEKRLSV